ncbi:MAG: histidine triad nucleotide-binding protein [Pseudomonadaceae bacterium]|nr:histidine triad nucleotide-binding protein [Pseudomonadaceae bacterium]
MRHTLQDNPTVFGKILRKEIPADIVYENDHVLAFHTIEPQAPVHVLIIPKQHIAGLQDATDADAATLGHLLAAANQVAKIMDVQQSGYRLITNAGKDAGQEVFHLHFHLLAGKPLGAKIVG